jgi:hypothetical protein
MKFATRDPLGMGIEYEGGRPGWNDALNGLPGMIGSGMPETFELKLLLTYIRDVTTRFQRPIIIPIELAQLIELISTSLDVLDESEANESDLHDTIKVPKDLFEYWDRVASAREAYRGASTFSGKTQEYSSVTVDKIVTRWLRQLEYGIQRAQSIGPYKAKENNNDIDIPPTYFSFNVTKWILTGKKNEEGHGFVNAIEMIVNKFPLFLEGPVRMMKTIQLSETKLLFDRVKTSSLHDDRLGMYTLSSRQVL